MNIMWPGVRIYMKEEHTETVNGHRMISICVANIPQFDVETIIWKYIYMPQSYHQMGAYICYLIKVAIYCV